jgi:hypothetical protein
LFHNRFFPREEGGTNVRQVWVEVEVQKLLAMARNGRCAEIQATADHLGTPVDGLPFTKDGLEPFLQSAARTISGHCLRQLRAVRRSEAEIQNASTATAPDELLWAWLPNCPGLMRSNGRICSPRTQSGESQ